MSQLELFIHAKELITSEQYEEAESILIGLNLPQAKELLEELRLVSTQDDSTSSNSTSSHHFVRVADIPAGTQIGSLSFGRNVVRLTPTLLVLGASIVCAIIVGLIYWFISRYFYFYFIQPFIVMAIVGAFVSRFIKKWTLRNSRITLLIGLTAGIFMYGTYRYSSYATFQSGSANEIRKANPYLNSVQINFVIDEYLREKTGITGFRGFVQLQAQNGLNGSLFMISGQTAFAGDFRMEVGVTYLYWVLEIIIIVFGTASISSHEHSMRPVCENSGQWIDMQTIGYLLKEDVEEFVTMINQSDYIIAAALVSKAENEIRVDVGMCQPDADEALFRVWSGNDDIVRLTLIPGELARQFKFGST